MKISIWWMFLFHWAILMAYGEINPDQCWITLRWRHNGQDSVSNHQPHQCLLNRLFGCRSMKTSKLRVTGLCAGNSPGTGEFPAQMASNAENVYIWWRYHDVMACGLTAPINYYLDHCCFIVIYTFKITFYWNFCHQKYVVLPGGRPEDLVHFGQGTLSLTWFNFNLSMNK